MWAFLLLIGIAAFFYILLSKASTKPIHRYKKCLPDDEGARKELAKHNSTSHSPLKTLEIKPTITLTVTTEVISTSSDYDGLKDIRAAIRQAKEQGDIEKQLKYLSQFQQYLIQHDFPSGSGEMYRYVKFLEKHGMVEQAREEKLKVDTAFNNHLNSYRLKKVNKIQESKWPFVMFICDDEGAPEACKVLNNKVELKEKSFGLAHYQRCKRYGLCRCRIRDLSDRCIRLKGLEHLIVEDHNTYFKPDD